MTDIGTLVLRLTADAKAYLKAIEDAENKTKSTSQKLTDLWKPVTAALAVLAVVSAAAFASLQRAEEIQDADTALQAYAGSAEQAAAAQNAVREGADGMLSRFDATREAARILSLGIVDDNKQLEEFTHLAVSLGDSVGKEATPAIEDFTNALVTGRIMGLKDYGLNLKEVRDRAKELMAATAGLDEQTALSKAIMEVATDQLDKLEAGGYEAGDTTARLSANWQDFIDGLIRVGGPALNYVFEQIRFLDQMTKEDTLSVLNAKIVWTGLGEQVQLADGKVVSWTVAMQAAKDITNAQTEALDTNTEAMKGFQYSAEELQLFIKGPLGKEFDNFIDKQTDLRQQADELRGKIDELNGKPWLTAEQRQQLVDYKTKLGDINQAMRDNADTHDEATKRIALDLLTQQAAVDGLSEQELGFLAEVAKQWGLFDTATATATDAASKALEDFASGDEWDDVIRRYDDAIDRAEYLKMITSNIYYGLPEGTDIGKAIENYYNTPGRAMGGPVSAGALYQINEPTGPGGELFRPAVDGQILNQAQVRDDERLLDEIRGLRGDLRLFPQQMIVATQSVLAKRSAL